MKTNQLIKCVQWREMVLGFSIVHMKQKKKKSVKRQETSWNLSVRTLTAQNSTAEGKPRLSFFLKFASENLDKSVASGETKSELNSRDFIAHTMEENSFCTSPPKYHTSEIWKWEHCDVAALPTCGSGRCHMDRWMEKCTQTFWIRQDIRPNQTAKETLDRFQGKKVKLLVNHVTCI